MKRLIRNFLGDQRGNVALISAACISMGLGCAALGIDIGKVFTDRRKLQSTADLAAPPPTSATRLRQRRQRRRRTTMPRMP